MKPYRRFKSRYKLLHILIVSAAIVMLWRGIWGLLDIFLLPDNVVASYISSVVVAFLILYIDDFHLKELE